MTKENPSDDYEVFYVEIPRAETDPLNSISNDIQDEHEQPFDGFRGLSDEQVSEIARDSLADAQEELSNTTDAEQLTFDNDSPTYN